jgi:hypothetical protein
MSIDGLYDSSGVESTHSIPKSPGVRSVFMLAGFLIVDVRFGEFLAAHSASRYVELRLEAGHCRDENFGVRTSGVGQ